MSKEEKILEELFPIMDDYVERTQWDKKERGFAISGGYEPVYPAVGDKFGVDIKVPDIKEKIEKGEIIGQFHTHPPPHLSGLPSTNDACYSSHRNLIYCIGGKEEICCIGPDRNILSLCREHDHYAEMFPFSKPSSETERIWHRMSEIRGQIDMIAQRNVICRSRVGRSREKTTWRDVCE